MKDSLATSRSIRRLAVRTAGVIALTALPSGAFPPPWLLAFAAPALVLHLLRNTAGLGPHLAFAIAAIVQLGAVLAVTDLLGPLDRLAALGCTLVPPMVYLAARASGSDVLRALFLAFCLLLIGGILGETPSLLAIGFAAAGLSALQVDTAIVRAEERYSWRGRRATLAARTRSLASLTTLGVGVLLITFQLLRELPTPAHAIPPSPTPATTPADPPRAHVGLSDGFDFGDGGGALLDLRADEIVRVSALDRYPLPGDLYLRCGHFDIAGLDQWRVAAPRLRRARDQRWELRAPVPGVVKRHVGVRLVEPSATFAFVPPGAIRITGQAEIVGDREREFFRFLDTPPAGTTWQVTFQNVHLTRPDALPVSGAAELLRVGDDVLRARAAFDEILATPRVAAQLDPFALAEAIAAELHARCSYSLDGPKGPFEHAVLNFLQGERRCGFCMHFASVTAICLRLAGVPCRIGVGLYGGDRPDDDWAARSFGSRHAHAWVEIPIDGYGFVVFDPTPAAHRSEPRSAQPAVEPPAEGAPDAVEATTAVASLWRPLDRPWPWLAALAGAAALMLGGGLWRRGERTTAERGRPSADANAARRLLDKLLRRLADHGRARRPGEPLEAFGARLGLPEPLDNRVLDAFAAYQEVRFGCVAFGPAHRERLARAVEEVRALERAAHSATD